MNYKIGQVSKFLQMPSETIRFYEKEHVIEPDRIPGSKYRTYSAEDILDLVTCMKYRSMDFPLKDSISMMQQEAPERLGRRMMDKYEEKCGQIDYQRLLADYAREKGDRILSAPYNKGNLWVHHDEEFYTIKDTELPELSDVSNSKKETSIDRSEASAGKNTTLQSWIQAAPFSELCLFPQDEQSRFGFLMEKRCFDYLHMAKNDPVSVHPAGLYLHTVVESSDPASVSHDLLQPALFFVGKNEFQVTGEPVAEVLVRIHGRDSGLQLLEVRIPIQGGVGMPSETKP